MNKQFIGTFVLKLITVVLIIFLFKIDKQKKFRLYILYNSSKIRFYA